MSKFDLRQILINSILFIGSLVFVIIILEISFRIYFKNDYSVPSHRDWLFRKNWDTKFANLNTLGHRDHEFSVVKPPDTFRILAIGDSLTYGEGVNQIDDIFTEILENKLNENQDNIKYEVLNIAQRGFNVKEYLSLLRDQGLSYQPDLVMIGFYMNDIEEDKSKRPKNNIIIPESLQWALSRISYLYYYSSNRVIEWKNRDSFIEYYLNYTSLNSKDWKRFVSYWKEILGLCKINNIRTLVIILPCLSMLEDGHPFISVYKNVEELSKDNDANVLNLFPSVKGRNPSDLWIGVIDNHPNEKAHQIFAYEIYEFLKKEKLLSRFN